MVQAKRLSAVAIVIGTLAACGSATGSSGQPATGGSSPSSSQLVFSGQLAGSMPSTKGSTLFCGPSSASSTSYNGDASGSINGTVYVMSVSMQDGYHGAGTYKIGLNNPASVTVGHPTSTTDPSGVTTTTTDAGFSAISGTVVINADQQSGTVDADLTAGPSISTDSTKVGHVSGPWSCAGGR